MTDKVCQTEAAYEQALDRMVMRRLATDRVYANAENCEQQAEREREIEDECIRELEHQAWLRVRRMAEL